MTHEPIDPDTKDWTWVLTQPCAECGFDPAMVHPTEVAGKIRSDAADWVARLNEPGVRTRRQPTVWSTLEYGCHVRDVHRIFDRRVGLMLSEDEPQFPNWDQDETAIADRYWEQDPAIVADDLVTAGDTVAASFAAVEGDEWQRPGRRSDGARFTVESFGRYFVHDWVHHAWDVGAA